MHYNKMLNDLNYFLVDASGRFRDEDRWWQVFVFLGACSQLGFAEIWFLFYKIYFVHHFMSHISLYILAVSCLPTSDYLLLFSLENLNLIFFLLELWHFHKTDNKLTSFFHWGASLFSGLGKTTRTIRQVHGRAQQEADAVLFLHQWWESVHQ